MAPRPLPALPPLPLSSRVPPLSSSSKLERRLSWSTSDRPQPPSSSTPFIPAAPGNITLHLAEFEEAVKSLRPGVPKEIIDELKMKTIESYGRYAAKEDHKRESLEVVKSTQSSSHTWTTSELPRSRSNIDKSTVSTLKPLPPPPSWLQDSTNALAYERDLIRADSIKAKPISARLQELRKLMAEEALDYYIVPSEDPCQSGSVIAESDKRLELISGFSGLGQAIISKSCAYLLTDARYWYQVREQVDRNWKIVDIDPVEGPKDWIVWLGERVRGARIGIDALMVSHEKAMRLKAKLGPLDSTLFFPLHNLIDLAWQDKPPRSQEPVYVQGIEFTGKDALYKLDKLRGWIKRQPVFTPSNLTTEPQVPVGTLITSLPCVGYILNMRGSDTAYSTLFHAYLFVGLEAAIIFLDGSKMNERVVDYLKSIGVERRDYDDVWSFLRLREWGEGKLLMAPQTGYEFSLKLTPYRYTIAPCQVEHMMAVKNATEVDSMKRAHLQGGISFVRFLAWLEDNLSKGHEVPEYEASARLTGFARLENNFICFSHKHISASGPNPALSRHSSKKSLARMIGLDGPYLIGAGIHYRDGVCETARTVIFSRPTVEQSDAYTRVLQAHIAMASAVFVEGTPSHQLVALSHKALSQEDLDFMRRCGYAGSFLSVLDSPQCFSGNVPLMAGHIVSIEPTLYYEGSWSIRIQSSYVVRRVKTQDESDDNTFLAFERLTCVPIQLRMVKEGMLTKAEKAWLRDHNRRCHEKLSPQLLHDKRALSWVKHEYPWGPRFLTTPSRLPSAEWALE